MKDFIYLIAIAILSTALIFVEHDHYQRSQETVAVVEQLTEARSELSRLRGIVKLAFDLDSADKVSIWSTPVTVSAYTAQAGECDTTPEVTADMTPSRIGVIAVSRDMIEVFGLVYGERVMLIDPEEGPLGIFQVRDTMSPRWTKRVDILHGNVKAARLFGVREGVQLVRIIERRVKS